MTEVYSEIQVNRSNSTLLADVDYPSLEVVDADLQLILVILFSLTACLSLTGNLTVIAILVLGKR